MDLSVSPDFDAYICYAIVLLIGGMVAVGQTRQRIGEVPGIWMVSQTWWLFLLYIGVPAVLFWLLDRTSAINDTSLFAAILVGFSYERIIAGGGTPGTATPGSIRGPADISQFWSPFQAYADRIAATVRAKAARRREMLADDIVKLAAEDPKRLELLVDLARKYAPDLKAFNERIAAIDGGDNDNIKALQRARASYDTVLIRPDTYELLRDAKVIDVAYYHLRISGLSKLFNYGFGAGVLILAIIIAALSFKPMSFYATDYYLWRVVKPNSTANDQYRALQNLRVLLHQPLPPGDTPALPAGATKEAQAAKAKADEQAAAMRKAAADEAVALQTYATERLALTLRRPGLAMERVEVVMRAILENRDAIIGQRSVLPGQLAEALRGMNVDARTRIHETLKFLGDYCKSKPVEDLAKWAPGNGDSVVQLERRIKAWQDYWTAPCDKP